MWVGGLRHIDDLPDSARVGIRLMVGGVALALLPFLWMRMGPGTYLKAAVIAASFHSESFKIPFGLNPLNYDFLFLAAICFLCGAFIFFRKLVWILGERRDEKVITRLDLK